MRFDASSPKQQELEVIQLKLKENDVTWTRQLLDKKYQSLLASLDATQNTVFTTSDSQFSSSQRSHQLGQLFGFSRALCHNDLLSGNVLLSTDDVKDEDRAVFLIDYEYASYNYRAFDIANHFIGTH